MNDGNKVGKFTCGDLVVRDVAANNLGDEAGVLHTYSQILADRRFLERAGELIDAEFCDSVECGSLAERIASWQ